MPHPPGPPPSNPRREQLARTQPALQALAGATSAAALAAALRDHPLLLEPATDELLTWLFNQSWRWELWTEAAITLACRAFLEHYRRRGGAAIAAAANELPLAAYSPLAIIFGRTAPAGSPAYNAQLPRLLNQLRPATDYGAWSLYAREQAAALARRGGADWEPNLERALELYRLVCERARERDDLRTLGLAQIAMGDLHKIRLRDGRRENIKQAQACYAAARDTLRVTPHREELARAAYHLALARYDDPGEDRRASLRAALDCCVEARAIFTAEAHPRQLAHVLLVEGNLHCQPELDPGQERLRRALACYRQALSLSRRAGDTVLAALVQIARGNAYADLTTGDRAANQRRAIACYRLALRGLDERAQPEHWAEARNNLGTVYSEYKQGDRARNQREAVACLHAALTVHTPATYPHDARRAARNLGAVLFAAGNWREASAAYLTAIRANEQLYAASATEPGRQDELAEARDLYPNCAYALAQMGKVRAAAVILERGRARGISEALARDRADLDTLARRDPAVRAAFVAAARAERDLVRAQRKGMGAEPPKAGPPSEAAVSVEEAARARARLREVIARVRRLKGFERFLAEPRWRDIAAAVRPGAPLVYLVTTPAGSLAMLVHQPAAGAPARAEVVAAPDFTSAQLDDILYGTRLHPGLLKHQLHPGHDFQKALALALSDLWELLVVLLANRLRQLGAPHVTLIPCGRLALLPIHAAGIRHGNSQSRCLLDQLAVAYAPSARILVSAREEAARRRAGVPRLTGVGNPNAGGPQSLPYARAELRSIAALVERAARTLYGAPISRTVPPRRPPRVRTTRALYGVRATRGALLRALSAATVAHFACHGSFDPFVPLESGLLLARGERLRVRDLLGPGAAKLGRLRLAVLSACQTAIADFRRLPDESLGLPGALLQARVPAVVGSLWAVDDASTALLVHRFYTLYLYGDRRAEPPVMPGDPAAALRGAQLWLRSLTAAKRDAYKARYRLGRPIADAKGQGLAGPARGAPATQRPFADPIFWAPFVFYGASGCPDSEGRAPFSSPRRL